MPRSSARKKKKADAEAEEVDEESISGPDDDADDDDDVESSEDEILAAAMAAKMAAPASSSTPSSRKRTPTQKAKAAAAASPKTPPKSAAAKAKAKAKSPSSGSPRKGSTGAKRTKPAGESQKEAQARCLEARTAGLAMLAPLDLDGREAALNAEGRRTLRDPQDDEYISPLNCLVRSQIEIFRATEDHPKASFVQQVGLRCVNCATACMADPDNARAAAGAEKFPQCKDNIGAAIRNWHRTHIVFCQYRPEEIVPIYDALRDMQVRAGNKGINYYQLAHDRLDLIDVSSGKISGVALKPRSAQVMAQSAGMNLARSRGSGRKPSAGGGTTSPNSTPTKKGATAGGSKASSSSPSPTASAKKKKKLGKEPKASVAAILDGTIASPVVRSNPDRPLKKVYGSDEYVSDPEGGGDSSSEEEIEVTSDEEEDESSDEEVEEEEDRKPRANSSKKKTSGTPDEYKEVEALDLGTMERVGLYRATADASAQLGIDSSNILKACRDGGGYVEQYFIRFANEEGAAHAAEIESVYQPTEEEVQKYIERARQTCAESAAKKRDEDDEEASAASPMPSDDGRGGTAEERYGAKVDSLVKEVLESQGIAVGGDDSKDEAAEARRQLIRHQLLQRMKMADKAGVSPDQFCKRYMAQLRVNDERESKAQIKKRAKSSSGKKKKPPKKASGKAKEASKPRQSTGSSRTIGSVRKAAEEALRKRKLDDDDDKKPAKKKPKKGEKITGHWSTAEDILLLEAMCKFGHDWASCAEYVGSRTHIQCKSRHQKMELKGLVQYD